MKPIIKLSTIYKRRERVSREIWEASKYVCRRQDGKGMMGFGATPRAAYDNWAAVQPIPFPSMGEPQA